jgi:4-hydroxymandelate oxidase
MDKTSSHGTESFPINLQGDEVAARRVLPQVVFDYLAGGAQDEVTLRANWAAFERWRLLSRVLRGPGQPSTETSVLGHKIALPVLIAPTAFHRLVHNEGELAVARAARASGTIYVMSTSATVPMEIVGPEAGPWWFQLYAFKDREYTRDLIVRAQAAGATAIVVTVDMPAPGRREAELRNGFALPPGVVRAHFPAATSDPTRESNAQATLSSARAALESALTWRDLDWLATQSPLPVVPKGILHPDDAVRAFEHGAKAVIVSNHGGRQLDSVVASLDALPAVVAAVAERGDVLVDSGARRGLDVLKAIALGARAILIGRPVLWGLALSGEDGVTRVLNLLHSELRRDMYRCGLASLGELDRSLVIPTER